MDIYNDDSRRLVEEGKNALSEKHALQLETERIRGEMEAAQKALEHERERVRGHEARAEKEVERSRRASETAVSHKGEVLSLERELERLRDELKAERERTLAVEQSYERTVAMREDEVRRVREREAAAREAEATMRERSPGMSPSGQLSSSPPSRMMTAGDLDSSANGSKIASAGGVNITLSGGGRIGLGTSGGDMGLDLALGGRGAGSLGEGKSLSLSSFSLLLD